MVRELNVSELPAHRTHDPPTKSSPVPVTASGRFDGGNSPLLCNS